MTYIVGKDDLIGLPRNTPFGCHISPEVFYANPNMDRFYSKYGFAYPLDTEGVPYSVVMDGLIPESSMAVARHEVYRYFLLIDHKGVMWKAVFPYTPEGEVTVAFFHIDVTQGWWATGQSKEIIDGDTLRLVGYLRTDPTPDDVDEYWFTHCGARKLDWVSLTNIVVELNTRYPKSVETEKGQPKDV